MTIRPSMFLALLAAGVVLPAAPLAAQPLGSFSWQLQPFCNNLTVNVTQQGSVYTMDGYDDQCGSGQRAPLVGIATQNPDGTIGFGLHIITVPGGRAVDVDARITLATMGGPWSDSAGNLGTLGFNARTGGLPRPLPTIPSVGLTPGSVTTEHLAPAAVTTAKIADGSITTPLLAPGAVTTAKIAGGSITTALLAPAAVNTANLAGGSITTALLAPAAVTTANIAGGSITTALLAPSAVTTANIANGSVTPQKLAVPMPQLRWSGLTTSPTLLPEDTDVVVRTVTMVVPAAGQVMVNASGLFTFGASGGGFWEYLWCSITTGAGVENEQYMFHRTDASGAGNNNVTDAPFAGTRVYAVTPGSFTVNLACREGNSYAGMGVVTGSIQTAQLTALFVPN